MRLSPFHGHGLVLHNSAGVVLIMFSKHVSCMESNEAEVVAILEAFQIFSLVSFNENLVVESDSFNAIFWASSSAKFPRRFQFYVNENTLLSSMLRVKFQHEGRMDNGFADCLAKQVVDRSLDLLGFKM